MYLYYMSVLKPIQMIATVFMLTVLIKSVDIYVNVKMDFLATD